MKTAKAALVIANAVLILAVVNGAILHKQSIVDSGTQVFLELAPLDPRSLMQGDYMALAYAIANDEAFLDAAQLEPTRGRIVLKIDDRRVAEFARLDDGTELDASEVFLKYRKWRRGFRFGIESFFFEEGSAGPYEQARFADARISSAGEAVLVDLRGQDLVEIDPTAGQIPPTAPEVP